MKNFEETEVSRRTVLAGIVSFAAAAIGSFPVLAHAKPAAKKWDAAYELAIDYEIASQQGRRTHRPYIAIFVLDKAGNAIRTLTLQYNPPKGNRWLGDLREWMRNERTRSQKSGGNLADTVTSATRNAGKYSVVWDGKNDAGKLVDQGTYTVCVEAAREHGTYQLMRKEVTVANKPFKLTLEGNAEIAGATIDYRKHK